MKKLMFMFPLMIMGLFTACNDDDEGSSGNVDVIVGSWKISSIIVNDTDIYPLLVLEGVCEIENVISFHNDYTLTNQTFQEDVEGNCAAGPDESGTWSKQGNAYTITINGNSESATPDFSDNGNKFAVNQEFEGQMAVVTFSRQ